ncbi:MAG: hypothetical protein ACHQT6_05295 [Candidatus Acidiferrales bacterium]
MNRAFLAALLGATLLFAGACKSKVDDKEAIRSGIVKYLGSLKTLNVSAMDINITQATVNGNQAQAQVEIRLKNSPPDGASMKLSYNLEKRGDEWAVVKSQPVGGTMQHPAPGEMPAGGLPPGHPNVNGSAGQAPAGHPDFNGILKSAQPPAAQAPAASAPSSSTGTGKP